MAKEEKKEAAEAIAEAAAAVEKAEAAVPERYIATQDLVINGTWYRMGSILELSEDPHHAALRKMSDKETPAKQGLKKYDPQGDYQEQEKMSRIYDGIRR